MPDEAVAAARARSIFFTRRRVAVKNARMKKATGVVFLALMFALAGCLPVSTNPLSPPDTAVGDPRLAGVWYGKSGEDTIFLHFVPGKGAAMNFVEVDQQKSGDADTNIYVMFPSVLGGTRYMNVREKNGAGKNYYLARYRIEGGALTVWLMSEKPVSKAINNERIAGKIVVRDTGVSGADRDVTITSSTERLAAFVKKSDPEILFAEKFGTFKKLVLPSLDVLADSKGAKGVRPKTSVKQKKKASD